MNLFPRAADSLSIERRGNDFFHATSLIPPVAELVLLIGRCSVGVVQGFLKVRV